MTYVMVGMRRKTLSNVIFLKKSLRYVLLVFEKYRYWKF